MKIKHFLQWAWAFLLLLSACSPLAVTPVGNAAIVNAWFDAPLPGSVIYPPNPCQIVAHGSSPTGIALFEISINGNVTANVPSPDSQGTLVTLPYDCGISEPGDYQLQLRVRDNTGDWSNVAETYLSIEDTSPIIPSRETFPSPTLIPQEAATSTPPALFPAGIAFESVSTDTVYIGDNTCGVREVTFRVKAVDPVGVKAVVLFFRFQAGNTTEWQNESMSPVGGDLYERTVDVGALFNGSVPFDQATLQYQAVLQNSSDDISARTDVFSNISVLACQVPPPEATQSACSTFVDPRTCAAQGCQWSAVPGTSPTRYICKNP